MKETDLEYLGRRKNECMEVTNTLRPAKQGCNSHPALLKKLRANKTIKGERISL